MNTMKVVEIVRQIVAEKHERRRVPELALLVCDIMPHFNGSRYELEQQLQDAVEAGLITKHRTANDTAYKIANAAQ